MLYYFGELMRMAIDLSRIQAGIGGRKKYYIWQAIQKFIRSSQTVNRRILNHSISCDLQKDIDISFYVLAGCMKRHYENQPLTKLLKKLYKPGASFIDIGANIGFYSLIARYYSYRTYLLEPEPRHFDFLKRNESVFQNVIEVAADSSNHEGKLFVGADINPGVSSLIEATTNSAPNFAYSGSVIVICRTFDTVIHEVGIDATAIRLIKFDAEGSEYNVLEGMREFFSFGHRPHLWVEVSGPNSPRSPNSYEEVVGHLHKYGYIPYLCLGDDYVRFTDDMVKTLPPNWDFHFIPT